MFLALVIGCPLFGLAKTDSLFSGFIIFALADPHSSLPRRILRSCASCGDNERDRVTLSSLIDLTLSFLLLIVFVVSVISTSFSASSPSCGSASLVMCVDGNSFCEASVGLFDWSFDSHDLLRFRPRLRLPYAPPALD